jgi:adenosylcobinamide-GDP ribazoletransferase
LEKNDGKSIVKNIILGLKFSFSYFSILFMPFKKSDDLYQNSVLKSMLFFFPFVGLVIGSLTIIILYFVSNLSYFGLILSAVSYMVFYGFLHTEAILDVVDALYAKHGKKNSYKIIKEPTVGAMGVLFGGAFFLLKISALVYMFELNLIFQFLAIVMISRLILVFNIKFSNFHKKSYFLKLLQKNTSYKLLFYIFFIYCSIGYFLVSYQIFLVIIPTILISYLTIKFLNKKLGFTNGDIMGVSLEVSELIAIFTILNSY